MISIPELQIVRASPVCCYSTYCEHRVRVVRVILSVVTQSAALSQPIGLQKKR